MLKTITLLVPDGISPEELAEDNGLVLQEGGAYSIGSPTPEDAAETAVIGELGEAIGAFMQPYLEKLGNQRLGGLMIAQGVFHMVCANTPVGEIFQCTALAIDEAANQIAQQVASTLEEGEDEDEDEEEAPPSTH